MGQESTSQSPFNKINWTAILIVGILVFGGLGFYYTQTLKEKNAADIAIKNRELQQKQSQIDADHEIEQAKLNRELEADCQKQIGSMRLRFNNVESGGYNTLLEYCEITYKDPDTGKIESGNIKDMINAKNDR